MSDIIAAIATGRAPCAIGILRLSGPGCAALTGRVFTPKQPFADAPDRRLVLGLLHDRQGRAVSYTHLVQTAMGFLDAYELYDITSSANKMPGSYTTYLESYEMPYIYISPEGTLADLLTAAHEFGHFVDGYVNCNQTFSIDCSEVFSQALEYLTLRCV